jgi:hypothetical protein
MNNHIFLKTYQGSLIYSIIGLTLLSITIPESFSQLQNNSTQNTANLDSLSSDLVNENVQITKVATSSYNIMNDTTGLVGTFDNIYTITGSSDSLSKSKDVIITLITSDFGKSPTLGYIRAADVEHIFDVSNRSDSSPIALPNPFVDEQTINYTLNQEISNAIDLAKNIKFSTIAIQCNFGMNIMDWKCRDHGIFG